MIDHHLPFDWRKVYFFFFWSHFPFLKFLLINFGYLFQRWITFSAFITILSHKIFQQFFHNGDQYDHISIVQYVLLFWLGIPFSNQFEVHPLKKIVFHFDILTQWSTFNLEFLSLFFNTKLNIHVQYTTDLTLTGFSFLFYDVCYCFIFHVSSAISSSLLMYTFSYMLMACLNILYLKDLSGTSRSFSILSDKRTFMINLSAATGFYLLSFE